MFKKDSILDVNGVLDLVNWDCHKNSFASVLNFMYSDNEFRPDMFAVDKKENSIYLFSKNHFPADMLHAWMEEKEKGETVAVDTLREPMLIRDIKDSDKSVNGLIKIITDFFKFCDETELPFYSDEKFDKLINWRMTLMGKRIKFVRFSCGFSERTKDNESNN